MLQPIWNPSPARRWGKHQLLLHRCLRELYDFCEFSNEPDSPRRLMTRRGARLAIVLSKIASRHMFSWCEVLGQSWNRPDALRTSYRALGSARRGVMNKDGGLT